MEYLFHHKHFLQILCRLNLNSFQGDIEENVSGCFFSEHSVGATKQKVKDANKSNVAYNGVWYNWLERDPVEYWMSALLHGQCVGEFRSCY